MTGEVEEAINELRYDQKDSRGGASFVLLVSVTNLHIPRNVTIAATTSLFLYTITPGLGSATF